MGLWLEVSAIFWLIYSRMLQSIIILPICNIVDILLLAVYMKAFFSPKADHLVYRWGKVGFPFELKTKIDWAIISIIN